MSVVTPLANCPDSASPLTLTKGIAARLGLLEADAVGARRPQTQAPVTASAMRAAVPTAHIRQSPLSQPRHARARIWPPSAWGGSGAGAGLSSKVCGTPLGATKR